MFPLLAAEFDLTEQQVSLLTGVNVLTLGFANIILIPLSNLFGRRPVCILCGILVVLTNVWQALATSYTSLLAARACNGIVAATAETVMVQVIADMFFLYERGLWIGIYFTLFSSGAFLGPIIAGNIAQNHGWRSFLWLGVALTAFSTALLVVAFPETRYYRDNINANLSTVPSTSTSVQASSTDLEANDDSIVVHTGRGKPSMRQFTSVHTPKKRWLPLVIHDLITPIVIFFNPIVFWAALMLAGPADLLLLFNLTESGLLSSATYGWSPGAVGYSNFAFFGGGIVGAITAGPLSDWLVQRSTNRNKGVREAEMRLPALIPYVCFFIISHVVGAVGYERLWPWQAIIICGFGFSGAAVTSIPTIAISYAVDSYTSISGEIMIVGTVLKNVLGFCLSYWIFDVNASSGWVSVYMVQFAVSMFPIVLTVPFYLYGKKIRRWTKDSSIHKMDTVS